MYLTHITRHMLCSCIKVSEYDIILTITCIPTYSGLDVDKVFEYFNFNSSGAKKGASTFAIAYLLHKMILPARAAITIGGVPLIVRKLRSLGWMKGVAKTVTNQAKNNIK